MQTSHHILQEAPKVCLSRDSLQSQCILPLTQVVFQEPDGDQHEARGQIPENPPGVNTVSDPSKAPIFIKILYQGSDSNKDYIGNPTKIKKEIQ